MKISVGDDKYSTLADVRAGDIFFCHGRHYLFVGEDGGCNLYVDLDTGTSTGFKPGGQVKILKRKNLGPPRIKIEEVGYGDTFRLYGHTWMRISHRDILAVRFDTKEADQILLWRGGAVDGTYKAGLDTMVEPADVELKLET